MTVVTEPAYYSLRVCEVTDDSADAKSTAHRLRRALIKAGDAIEVKPPAGHSTPRSLDDDFLLFAGGSGITFGGIAGGRVDSVGAMRAARACTLATGRLGGHVAEVPPSTM